MPDTTGRIRAKALDTTGLTEGMLEKDWAGGAGRTRMAIVELRSVEPHGPNLDGKKRIDYVIESIEPVPERYDETMRAFQRGLFSQRPDQEGQATLKGTSEVEAEQLEGAAQALGAAVERDDDGAPVGIWDGDPDTPITTGPEGGAEVKVPAKKPGSPFTVVTDTCPAPGCELPAEHDGDHESPLPDPEG